MDDRAVDLLNSAHAHSLGNPNAVLEALAQLRELLVIRDGSCGLVRKFGAQILEFRTHSSAKVRKYTVKFGEDTLRKQPDALLLPVLRTIAWLVGDKAVAVSRRSITSMNTVVLPLVIKVGTADRSRYKASTATNVKRGSPAVNGLPSEQGTVSFVLDAWRLTLDIADRVATVLQKSDNAALVSVAAKFLQQIVLVFSPLTHSDVRDRGSHARSVEQHRSVFSVQWLIQRLDAKSLESRANFFIDAIAGRAKDYWKLCIPLLRVIAVGRSCQRDRVLAAFYELAIWLKGKDIVPRAAAQPSTTRVLNSATNVAKIRKCLCSNILQLWKACGAKSPITGDTTCVNSVEMHEIPTILAVLGMTKDQVALSEAEVASAWQRKANSKTVEFCKAESNGRPFEASTAAKGGVTTTSSPSSSSDFASVSGTKGSRPIIPKRTIGDAIGDIETLNTGAPVAKSPRLCTSDVATSVCSEGEAGHAQSKGIGFCAPSPNPSKIIDHRDLVSANRNDITAQDASREAGSLSTASASSSGIGNVGLIRKSPGFGVSSVAMRMMQSMGFRMGQGLGANNDGEIRSVAQILEESRLQSGAADTANAGLGFVAETSASGGARKRSKLRASHVGTSTSAAVRLPSAPAATPSHCKAMAEFMFHKLLKSGRSVQHLRLLARLDCSHVRRWVQVVARFGWIHRGNGGMLHLFEFASDVLGASIPIDAMSDNPLTWDQQRRRSGKVGLEREQFLKRWHALVVLKLLRSAVFVAARLECRVRTLNESASLQSYPSYDQVLNRASRMVVASPQLKPSDWVKFFRKVPFLTVGAASVVFNHLCSKDAFGSELVDTVIGLNPASSVSTSQLSEERVRQDITFDTNDDVICLFRLFCECRGSVDRASRASKIRRCGMQFVLRLNDSSSATLRGSSLQYLQSRLVALVHSGISQRDLRCTTLVSALVDFCESRLATLSRIVDEQSHSPPISSSLQKNKFRFLAVSNLLLRVLPPELGASHLIRILEVAGGGSLLVRDALATSSEWVLSNGKIFSQCARILLRIGMVDVRTASKTHHRKCSAVATGLPVLLSIWSRFVQDSATLKVVGELQEVTGLLADAADALIAAETQIQQAPVDKFGDEATNYSQENDKENALQAMRERRLGCSGAAFFVATAPLLASMGKVEALLPRVMATTVRDELGGAAQAAVLFNSGENFGMSSVHRFVQAVLRRQNFARGQEKPKEISNTSDAMITNREAAFSGVSRSPLTAGASDTGFMSAVDLLTAFHFMSSESDEVKYMVLHATKLRPSTAQPGHMCFLGNDLIPGLSVDDMDLNEVLRRVCRRSGPVSFFVLWTMYQAAQAYPTTVLPVAAALLRNLCEKQFWNEPGYGEDLWRGFVQFVDLTAELGKLGTICAAVVELPSDRFSQLTDVLEDPESGVANFAAILLDYIQIDAPVDAAKVSQWAMDYATQAS